MWGGPANNPSCGEDPVQVSQAHPMNGVLRKAQPIIDKRVLQCAWVACIASPQQSAQRIQQHEVTLLLWHCHRKLNNESVHLAMISCLSSRLPALPNPYRKQCTTRAALIACTATTARQATVCCHCLPAHTQVFPYHLRLRGPPSPHTAAVDRGLWLCKPFYTGDNEGGVIYATWPELQVTHADSTVLGWQRLGAWSVRFGQAVMWSISLQGRGSYAVCSSCL
jgi:hypothetical protein